MNLDLIFVASILKEGSDAVRAAVERVSPEFLQGEGKNVYQFVLDYVKTYGSLPDPAMVHGKTGVQLPDPPPAPAAFFLDEVLNRRLHGEIGKQLREVIQHFEARKPQEAYRQYEEGLRELRKLDIAVGRTVSLPSLAPDFLEYYDRLKAGETGILTPWPTINEATLGFWPEDFVLFVARLGVGKTWTLTLLADYAWHVCGKRVLFATTEMSQIKILQRWVAVHFRLTYNDLRRGQLGDFAEQKMREGLAALIDAEGLDVIGGDFDFRIESLEAAIEYAEPDILFVDGAYLLRTLGDGRIEKAANSFDELKRVAKRNKIPVVSSTQFNREVKANKLNSASVEKIALSDAAGWNADLIYGLVQTEDMRKDRRMLFKPLKFREGSGEDVETWWDFDMMMFDEVAQSAPSSSGGGGTPSGGSSKGDDPFGTGAFDFGDDGPGVPF